MGRHVAANALTVLIVGLFLLGGVVAWGVSLWSARGPLDAALCVRVPSGSTMREVASDLKGKGAIASGEVLRIGADYAGKTDDLKAGSFLVPEGASIRDIVDILTRGGASTCGPQVVWVIGVTRTEAQVRDLDPATGRFLERAAFDPLSGEAPPPEFAAAMEAGDAALRAIVVEGTTAWQVVQGLNAIPALEGDVEAVPPEGSLAPGDYAIEPGTTVQALLDRMSAAQSEILAAAWARRAPGLPISTPEEALTLASLVEKETGVDSERPQVASVFVNRLRQGMRLQTDPAVIYGITEGQGTLGRGLRQSELDRATPYNTYIVEGLPPTPIANPGRAAIEAALNPDRTPYLFFVADGTGGHAFATTLEEHNRNVERWRAIEAEREAAAPAADAGN